MKWTDETSFISRGNSFKLTLPRLEKITNCGATLALFFLLVEYFSILFRLPLTVSDFFLFCSTTLITLEWSTSLTPHRVSAVVHWVSSKTIHVKKHLLMGGAIFTRSSFTASRIFVSNTCCNIKHLFQNFQVVHSKALLKLC